MDLTDAEASAQTAPVARSCTECGQPDEQGRFCGQCGAPLSGEPGTDGTPTPEIPEQVGADDERPTLFDDVLGPAPALTTDRAADPAAAQQQEEGDGEDSSSRAPRLTPRRAVAAGVAVAVSAGAILGGVVGARYLADGDVRTALTASSRDFNRVVDRLTAATTAEQISLAAGQATAAADRVEDVERRLETQKDPERTAVGNQLEAEQDVLQAVAELEGLARAPLASWGAAHSELAAALAAEDETRAALRQFDVDAARGLADTHRMLARSRSPSDLRSSRTPQRSRRSC